MYEASKEDKRGTSSSNYNYTKRKTLFDDIKTDLSVNKSEFSSEKDYEIVKDAVEKAEYVAEKEDFFMPPGTSKRVVTTPTIQPVKEYQELEEYELDELEPVTVKTDSYDFDVKEVTPVNEFPSIDEYKTDNSNESETNEPKQVSMATPLNKTKFMLMTLVYVMYEDDNEFSKKERKTVSTVIKIVGRSLPSYQQEELQQILERRPNLDMLFDKVYEYNLTPDDVYKTVNELSGTVKKNSGYEAILRRIENRMSYEL